MTSPQGRAAGPPDMLFRTVEDLTVYFGRRYLWRINPKKTPRRSLRERGGFGVADALRQPGDDR
jgi:hypothetical protein